MNGTARKVTIATAALLLPGAAGTLPGPPPPGLNVQLKFICLGLADDRLASIDTPLLGDLPDAPPPTSLAITTAWQSNTHTARSQIRDSLGNNLHIEESIGSRGACDGLPRDIFRLDRVGSDYEARFCISGQRPNPAPDVKVTMRVTGSPDRVGALAARVVAVASCLPSGGTTLLQGGVSVGRQLIRTLGEPRASPIR